MEVQKRNIQLQVETDLFSLNLQVMRVSALQLLRPAMLICHIQDMRKFRRSGRYISLRLYTVDIWRSSNLKKREAWGPDVSFTRMRERQRSSWWMHRREFPRSSFPGREYPENQRAAWLNLKSKRELSSCRHTQAASGSLSWPSS